MRVVCYQSGVEGISHGEAWKSALMECSLTDADLLVTPEFAVGGYPHTLQAIHDSAIADPSELLVYTAEAPPQLTVVLGFIEETSAGKHSAAAVIRNGEIIAIVRKMRPREPGLTPGKQSTPFTVADVQCGVLISDDTAEVKPARRLASAGARVLICPLNNDMDVASAARWQDWTEEQLVKRARDNDCWVVSADVAGRSEGRRALAVTGFFQPNGHLAHRTFPDPNTFLSHVLTWDR
ncbi:carbon-nitrogen hydrolase family protein [Phytoactinopolyspora endophytica]|uniref:carbon-nitrogen hydrolase family protein n=1 Tax=Phytoactinopolyspora endophytica TaxID=1642495 RepID=UPI00101E0E80|nr:carbon-nitrogen hydrolase family protein [Phytoactinopolyspora endophytica]